MHVSNPYHLVVQWYKMTNALASDCLQTTAEERCALNHLQPALQAPELKTNTKHKSAKYAPQLKTQTNVGMLMVTIWLQIWSRWTGSTHNILPSLLVQHEPFEKALYRNTHAAHWQLCSFSLLEIL